MQRPGLWRAALASPSAAGLPPAVSARGVTVRYPAAAQPALRGLDLDLGRGLHLVLGPAGAGGGPFWHPRAPGGRRPGRPLGRGARLRRPGPRAELDRVQRQAADRLAADLDALVASFDYRFQGERRPEWVTAVRRAIAWVTGTWPSRAPTSKDATAPRPPRP